MKPIGGIGYGIGLCAAAIAAALGGCVPFQSGNAEHTDYPDPFVLPEELAAVKEILAANGLGKNSPYGFINADPDGHVEVLRLSGCLLDSLPDVLGRFPFLQYLYLEDNRLRDLPDVSGLRKLEQLTLGGNRLCHVPAATGARLDSLQARKLIPTDWLEGQDCPDDFAADSLAVRAILDSNGLAGVEVMSVVKRRGDVIRALDLGLRKLRTLPAEIGELEWLETLRLESNRIPSLPTDIGKLGRLRILHAEGNSLSAIPEGICASKGLDSLMLGDNRLAYLPGCLIGFDSLSINVDRNGICDVPQSLIDWLFARASSAWQRSQTCAEPVGYAADSILVREMLDLSGSKLEVRDIATVKKGRITKLRIDTYGIIVPTPNLARLDSLDTLEIRNSPLTGLPESIGDLPRLKSLHIYSSKLASLPEGLGRIKTLESIYIAIGGLTELPSSLGGLTRLKRLHVPGHRIAALPERIGELAALEELDASQNALTAVPAGINKCANLRNLNFEFNRVSGFPFRPDSLPKLVLLTLRGNALASLPAWITGFGNRVSMELGGNSICNPEPAVQSWIAASPSVKMGSQQCAP